MPHMWSWHLHGHPLQPRLLVSLLPATMASNERLLCFEMPKHEKTYSWALDASAFQWQLRAWASLCGVFIMLLCGCMFIVLMSAVFWVQRQVPPDVHVREGRGVKQLRRPCCCNCPDMSGSF